MRRLEWTRMRRLRAGEDVSPRSREAGVTVRANYVALPFAAARDADEGGESRWIRVRPSDPEVRSPRPKSPRMERREATRFRRNIVSHAMPEATQHLCAARRSMPLNLSGQT